MCDWTVQTEYTVEACRVHKRLLLTPCQEYLFAIGLPFIRRYTLRLQWGHVGPADALQGLMEGYKWCIDYTRGLSAMSLRSLWYVNCCRQAVVIS